MYVQKKYVVFFLVTYFREYENEIKPKSMKLMH